MGLDISAASKIRLVPCNDDENCNHDIRIYVNEDFPAQADGLANGCYESDGEVEDDDYPSRAYSGYNRFREALSQMALNTSPERVWNDPEHFEGQPFVEMIHFSDCEGVIGPKTSAKLAKDFDVHADAAEQIMNEHDFATYEGFRRAFKRASDNGAVMFH